MAIKTITYCTKYVHSSRMIRFGGDLKAKVLTFMTLYMLSTYYALIFIVSTLSKIMFHISEYLHDISCNAND